MTDRGSRTRGAGFLLLVACTADNPAYEGESSATSAGSGATSGIAETEGQRPEDMSAGPSATSTTTDGASDEPAATGTTDANEDPGDEPPPEVGSYDVLLLLPISDPFAEDDDPTLPADMLELYFASRRVGGMGDADIWVARRGSLEEPWDEPEPEDVLNSTSLENTPEISLDGLTMLLSSTRGGSPDEDVYVSTRRDRGSPWTIPVPLPALSSNVRDVCPFVSAAGDRAYVCNGPGLMLDVVLFERDGDAWLGPWPLEGVNTPSLECCAWVDPSERVIAFMSNRPGGMGDTDLYVATRASSGDSFDEPEPIAGLNLSSAEDDPWISPEGDVVFFASSRSGIQDLYVAYRGG